MVVWTFVVLAVMAVDGLDNGVGRTPAMGYNTWNDFRCNINAEDIKAATDSFLKYDLPKYGYEYVNIDDCWASSRLPNGTIQADSKTFPRGIKPIADYVHSKGLKFGIYTDRGTKTCAGAPGSQGYEKIDAATYASWGVDYLKEDSCNAPTDHETAFKQYGLMRDALNSTGREIYFSLCGWNKWYAPVGFSLGNSWRIAGDCNKWKDVLTAIDTNAPLAKYAKPGGWNDPDMLIGSSTAAAAFISEQQSRTMFSMWAIMTAPLLIGSNIQDLKKWDLETYTNAEVIAVDQDPLGAQGIRLEGGNFRLKRKEDHFQVEMKKCDPEKGEQKWQYRTSEMASSFTNENTDLCLDTNSCDSSSKLVFEDCKGDVDLYTACPKVSQKFDLKEKKLVSALFKDANLCVDIESSDSSLDLVDCAIASTEWTYDTETRQLIGDDLCLESADPQVSSTNVWGKLLADGSWAVTFLNNGEGSAAPVECSSKCFLQMGFSPDDSVDVYDLWEHKLVITVKGSYKVQVDGGGASRTFKLTKKASSI